LNVGDPTLRDIAESLARPERDPREDLPKPIFKRGVLKLEDLSAGMELKGTVLNVVDFGAFVDIGLKDSGLVHISQLANRYIKSPHDVVSVGDVVTVWVMGVDQERKRVSLTMVKPGTERPRGSQGGRRGGGGEGHEGRGGGRPPPREGSAPAASQPAGVGVGAVRGAPAGGPRGMAGGVAARARAATPGAPAAAASAGLSTAARRGSNAPRRPGRSRARANQAPRLRRSRRMRSLAVCRSV